MKKQLLRFGWVSVAAGVLFSGSAVADQPTVERQTKNYYRNYLAGLAADDVAMTQPPRPDCEFVGTWSGGYLGGKVSLTLDVHADGTREGWIVSGPGGFGSSSDEYDIVFVNRVNWKVVPSGTYVRPSSDDLASGMDVYLCPKKKPAPQPQPLVLIRSIDPLVIDVIPQGGTTWTGNIVFTNPPGVSEIESQFVPVTIETPFSVPIVIQTTSIFPVVPGIVPQFFGGAPTAGHTFKPLAVAPIPNDRIAFVWEVTPSQTLWRPIFRQSIDGGPTLEFVGPRNFIAGQPQIISLNVLSNLVPAGTGIDDIDLSIPSSSPPNLAPPESHVFQRGPVIEFTDDGGNDQLSIETTLYNPTGNITFTNDSVGVAATNCGTGFPYFTARSTLNNTIAAGSHAHVEFDLKNAVTFGIDLPELPDADSPTFIDDMFDWLDEVCIVVESHPALTLN